MLLERAKHELTQFCLVLPKDIVAGAEGFGLEVGKDALKVFIILVANILIVSGFDQDGRHPKIARCALLGFGCQLFGTCGRAGNLIGRDIVT